MASASPPLRAPGLHYWAALLEWALFGWEGAKNSVTKIGRNPKTHVFAAVVVNTMIGRQPTVAGSSWPVPAVNQQVGPLIVGQSYGGQQVRRNQPAKQGPPNYQQQRQAPNHGEHGEDHQESGGVARGQQKPLNALGVAVMFSVADSSFEDLHPPRTAWRVQEEAVDCPLDKPGKKHGCHQDCKITHSPTTD